LAYLLAKRDLEVVAYDVQRRKLLTDRLTLDCVIGTPRSKLNFPDQSFDAVVGCGVLEHVADIDQSLYELRRILRPHGVLFIYNFPNSRSYVEWTVGRLSRTVEPSQLDEVISHERATTLKKLMELIASYGFEIRDARYEDFLPVSLRTFPSAVRLTLNRYHATALRFNRILESIPGLRSLSTNLTVVAERR
jgi:ubiquinone/menaquinone biosynthesis C-methylase UbiE